MLRTLVFVIAAVLAVHAFPSSGGRGPHINIVSPGRFGGNVISGGRSFGQGGRQAFERQTVTFTVRQTVDRISTEWDFVYNTLPVTFTDFRIDTQTVTSRQVVHTPANDVLRITTRQDNNPTTIQVTNTVVDFRFATNLGTDTVTVTHTVEDVDFVTVTRTVQEQITVTSAEARTQFVTDYQTTTDVRYVTEYKFVRAGGYH